MLDTNVPLSSHSSYRIGGPARFFAAPRRYGELVSAVGVWRRLTPRARGGLFVLGGGTNLLIDDAGFDGLVLKPELQKISFDGPLVTAEAGAPMYALLEAAADRKLSGFEWAGGLPGTVGGAIRGNAGAFGGEIKDRVREVTSVDFSRRQPKVVRRKNAQCAFGYRTSVWKEGAARGEVILSATFKLAPGDRSAIREGIEERVRYRRERHPLEYPNIGSIFKNVDWCAIPARHRDALRGVVKLDPFPVVPTAYLIHQAGLKGVSAGGAMVSPKHPNFIVNVLEAKAGDVRALIRLVKQHVRRQFGVLLEEEVMEV